MYNNFSEKLNKMKGTLSNFMYCITVDAVIITIIIIVTVILCISFMQGIYIYIPETNHVPREHCIATILM